MKFRTLVVIALCAAVPALACAKKPKKVETPEAEAPAPKVEEEVPVITEECSMKVSLMHESVKNKQFADAYEPWYYVYTTCPNANKSIYTDGAKIIDWMWENAKDDEAKKAEIRELVMQLYDKRIKYFGDDPKYPRVYILGEKALDYCDHFDNDELKEPAYAWFKESIDALGASSKITVLTKFFEVSYGLFKSNPDKYMDQFMADYTLVTSLLQTIATNPANKNASAAAQQKDYVDNLFAISGAASCDKLDALYAPYVEANKESMENLTKVLKLYKRVGCTESEVYFAAALQAHQLAPSEESAAGCAHMCMKKEDWRGAIGYFHEALALDERDLEDDGQEDNADYLFKIAYIYYDKLKNYTESRSYCRRSLEVLPNQGRCYILIGSCYAAAKPYSESDYPAAKAAILNKSVFWAAVDQFNKAKQVDPSCADDANKLIAMYSKYFPTREEIFDLPNELGGASFIVGGWINEKTVCRPAK